MAEVAEGQRGTNGDLGPRVSVRALSGGASERREGGGEFHGIPLPGQDSPYRPGVRPKVPTGAVADGTASSPRILAGEASPRRGMDRSPMAAGPQTFGSKYMPFAAGFAHMSGEAPVYRSARLHAVNPTAAVSEDTSYLYTLDSGRETPATRAANPNQSAEHVRNTAAAASAQGGFVGKMFAPIR